MNDICVKIQKGDNYTWCKCQYAAIVNALLRVVTF